MHRSRVFDSRLRDLKYFFVDIFFWYIFGVEIWWAVADALPPLSERLKGGIKGGGFLIECGQESY